MRISKFKQLNLITDALLSLPTVFSNETIQTALTNVQSSCNDAQKAK